MVKLNELPGVLLTLVLVGAIGAAGLLTLTSLQSSLTVNGSAYNATGNAITAISNVFTNLGTVGTIVGVVVIIAVVIGAFAFGQKR